MDLPEYETYVKRRAFALKYVNIMQGIAAQRKNCAYLVEGRQPELHEEGYEQGEDELADDEGFENLDVDQRFEVLAVMKARGFQPTGRTATGRFQR